MSIKFWGLEMEVVTNLLWVISCLLWNCIHIGESANWYKLLHQSKDEADIRCKNEWNGTITIFRDYSSRELKQILYEHNDTKIWNGYQYTSARIENIGCFNESSKSTEFKLTIPDLTVAYCERFCKLHGKTSFAVKASDCVCVGRLPPLFFRKSGAQHCTYNCSMREDERCGSNINLTYYNVYTDRDNENKGNGSCLVYERRNGTEDIRASNCTSNLTTGFVACRLNNGNLVKIDVSPQTWTSSLNTCLQSKSYIVSYTDIEEGNKDEYPNGIIWLNERNYTTTVENTTNRLFIGEKLDVCEYLARRHDGTFSRMNQTCDNKMQSVYVCKIGHEDNEQSRSTFTYPQSEKQSPTSPTSTKKPRAISIEWTTSTLASPQNVSSDLGYSRVDAKDSDSGSLIGGVIGALVVILIIGSIIIVLFLRRRNHGPCKEESQLQSQKVNFSKSNGLTSMAYCSEATLNIIQGNPDRISQEYTTIKDEFRNPHEYTTIQDEKLQSIRVSNSERDTFENKNQSSPTNGPLFMVLEETHSKSEICNPPNYELAQPISSYGGKENASLHPDGREQKEGAMDYDHLRQEAYKQNMAEENVYNHGETDNDYSHISQVTKTNKTHIDDDDDDNDYDHTGNIQNHELTGNTGNDQDDTYAHAGGDGRTVDDQTYDDDDDDYAHTQTKENHHQTSIMRIDQDDTYAHAGGDGTTADGMRDVGPYDPAQNVHRPDDDSKEYSDNMRGIGPYELAHNVNRPDVDDQESSNDMKEIGPYEFAHNIDRRENGTTESTQDTFVKLGTEEGNYSLAEPIDMNSGHYE